MKKLLLALFCGALLAGCTYTNNYESGTKIDVEKVNQIVKGKTTEADLVSMFGQPFSKSVVSQNESKWLYAYNFASASAQAFTMKTTSSAETTTLDILLRDGVVINYTYSKTPVNPAVTMSNSL